MREDYKQITNVIEATIGPLVAKLQTLENKVDALNMDRVTRSDIEKLQQNIASAYVPRDSYEPRHAALIERDVQLENNQRDLRNQYESDMKELRASIKEAFTKLYDTIEEVRRQNEERFKDQQELQLSAQDRSWVRWSQVLGFVSIALSILGVVAQHIRFQ